MNNFPIQLGKNQSLVHMNIIDFLHSSRNYFLANMKGKNSYVTVISR